MAHIMDGTRRLRTNLRRMTQKDLDEHEQVTPAVGEMSALVGRRARASENQKTVFGRKQPAALKFRYPSGFNTFSEERVAREERLRLAKPAAAASLRSGFRFTSCFAGDATTGASREDSAPEPGVPGTASFGAFEEIVVSETAGKPGDGGAPMSVAARTMLNLEERRLTNLPKGQAPASPGAPHSPLGVGIEPEDPSFDHDPYKEYAAKVRAKVVAAKEAMAKEVAARHGSAPGDSSTKLGVQTVIDDGSFALGPTTGGQSGQEYGFRFVTATGGSSSDTSMAGSMTLADNAMNQGGYFDTFDGETGTLGHSATRRIAQAADRRATEAARIMDKAKPGAKYLPLEALRRDQVFISRTKIQPLAWPDPEHVLALHTQGGNHWSLVVRSMLRAVGCEIQGEVDAALLDAVKVECHLPNSTRAQQKLWYVCCNDLDWGVVRSAALRDMEPHLPGEPVPPPPKLLCIVHLPSDLANKVANAAAGQHLTTTSDLRRAQAAASQAAGSTGSAANYNPVAPPTTLLRRSNGSQDKFTRNLTLPPPWPIYTPPAPPKKSNEIVTLSDRRRGVSSLYSKDEVERYSRPKAKSQSATANDTVANKGKSKLSPKREKQLHMAAYYKTRIENFTDVLSTKQLHRSRADILGLDL